jgi:exopolyphosphatase/pppGpp-phosphohydrolase
LIETKNATLVAELASAKQFPAKSLGNAAESVANLVKKIREDFKVPEKRIAVVGSSGLFVPLNGDEGLIKINKELLAEAVRKSTGLAMDFVSVAREAELTITSVIPPALRSESVLLDIGSGNTKGGLEKEGALVTFGIPFGTVSFHDRVVKEAANDDFIKTAARLRKEVLVPKLQEALKEKPELLGRKQVYLSGGAIWALTTFQKPADRSSMVPLAVNDFEIYSKFLYEHPKELPDADVSSIADLEVKKLALEDMKQVRKTFTRDQMIAGTEVLNALVEAFQLNAPDKKLYFARNAYIGWILGYVMEKGASK